MPDATAEPTGPPRTGDVYWTDSGDHIVVNRTARGFTWADITVTQPHGASWRKRQPLHDGRFPFRVHTRPADAVSASEEGNSRG